MSTITTKDGVEIFYKDWGQGQPIVFSHGWPLSADDWDTQMLFFVARAIASSPTTGAATAVRADRATGTTWTTTPMTWRRWPRISTCSDAVHVGHSPAAARWCTTSRATARAGSPRR